MCPVTFSRIFAASARQSFSVLSACMKTRAFCRKTGLLNPEVRMKWPSSTAPVSRKMPSTSSTVMSLPLPSSIHPAHVAHGGARLHLRDQAVEVLQIPHFQIDQHLGEV